MLDIKFIRENQDLVAKNNKNRGVKIDLGKLLELDEKRRSLIHDIEIDRAELKKGSKAKPGPEEIKKLKQLGDKIKSMEEKHAAAELEFLSLLKQVPNLTHPDVPAGSEKDFMVLETHGEKPDFGFAAKDHETLMTEMDLLDFERGAKVADSK